MKKVTAFLLALCLMVPVQAAQAAAVGEEIPAWAAEAYEALESRSISVVIGAGSISRGRFVQLLIDLLDKTVSGEVLAAYPTPEDGYFADADDWFYRHSYRAAGYGILEGSIGSDGLRYLNGEDKLTREQAAKMLVSLLDFFSQELGYTIEPSDAPAVYQDAASISSWALPYTQTVASYGLMKGDDQGNFSPLAQLDYPSAMVMASRTLALMDEAVNAELGLLPIQSQAYWRWASDFGAGDYQVAKPKRGWSSGYYTIDNGDGTLSGLVVDNSDITVERFAADGSLVSSKSLAMELPIFGAFLAGWDGNYYIAFGQGNDAEDDNAETFRIVKYDKDWNRVGSVSANGEETYTTIPFSATVARMTLSEDGILALHAARTRYTSTDGLRHQSNITFLVDSKTMSFTKIMGEAFPSNHVSHSFGQFVRFDGDTMVTVDHGDAYPRAFVLQKDGQAVTLLKIYGNTGDNVTNAIGSGLEVSDDGYLFLGCSNPQNGSSGPWNLFLAYVPRELTPPEAPWPEGSTNTSMELLETGQWQAKWTEGNTTYTRWFSAPTNDTDAVLIWLTHSDTTINTARLVKLDGDTFVAMWAQDGGIHWLKLDGTGTVMGEEHILSGAIMPPTDPVVMDGDICWIQYSEVRGTTFLYRLEVK